MVIINKYAEDIKAIMVGMETDQPTMEWPQLVSTITEQQLWLTEKLENIETVLMNLLKGKVNCNEYLQCQNGYIAKLILCITGPPATSDMLLVVGMTTAVLWKTLHQTAAMATRHAHAMTLQSILLLINDVICSVFIPSRCKAFSPAQFGLWNVGKVSSMLISGEGYFGQQTIPYCTI